MRRLPLIVAVLENPEKLPRMLRNFECAMTALHTVVCVVALTYALSFAAMAVDPRLLRRVGPLDNAAGECGDCGGASCGVESSLGAADPCANGPWAGGRYADACVLASV